MRDYRYDGSFIEVAWSSYEPSGDGDVVGGQAAALSALTREALPGEWIVVTWR